MPVEDTQTTAPTPAPPSPAPAAATEPSSAGGEPSGEPVAPGELAGASTEPPPVKEPTADSWDWKGWDGSTYDRFPEAVRPWVTQAGTFYGRRLTEAEKKFKDAQSQASHYQQMYEFETGRRDEDPRIAEWTGKYETLEAQHRDLETRHAAFEAEVQAEREAQVESYFRWFDEYYGDKMQAAVEKYGGHEGAEERMGSLMDLGFDTHVALEIALLGDDIIHEATELIPYVRDEAVLFEVLAHRHPDLKAHLLAGPGRSAPRAAVQPAQPDPPAPPPPRPEPPPAAALVAGSEPAARPADVETPQPVRAFEGMERTRRINSAAEMALRKAGLPV